MNTKTIRKMIDKAINHEKRTNDLANLARDVARQNGRSMTPDEARGVSAFVMGYVNMVPALLEEGLQASGRFGIRNEMQQMLNEVEYYWKLEQDLIPDRLGLRGICDDAYASLFLMQSLSDYCKGMHGQALLSSDLTGMNSVVRNLLGEPIAAALEQKVAMTIAQNMVGQVFNQAYQNIFSSGFSFGNYVNAWNSQREIEQQVNQEDRPGKALALSGPFEEITDDFISLFDSSEGLIEEPICNIWIGVVFEDDESIFRRDCS